MSSIIYIKSIKHDNKLSAMPLDPAAIKQLGKAAASVEFRR